MLSLYQNSAIYHPPYDTDIINKLSRDGYNVHRNLFRTSSSEIGHQCKASETQTLTDIFLRSGQDWMQFVNSCKKLRALKKYDEKAFNVIQEHQHRFKVNIFEPLFSYFISNTSKFQGNANKIITDQKSIYRYLNGTRKHLAQNRCVQFAVRYTLKQIETDDDEHHDEQSDDDDYDDYDDYDRKLKCYELQTRDRRVRPVRLLPTADLGTFRLSDYNNQISDIVRQNVPSFDVFGWNNIEVVCDGDDITIHNVNSNVPQCSIECRQVLNMLLHSIYSVQNTIHSLTFLYIVFNDCIMVYAYITNAHHRSFGSRIFEMDLTDTIPFLFEDYRVMTQIKTDIRRTLRFTTDGVYERYKLFLSRQAYREIHLQFHRTVIAWNGIAPKRPGARMNLLPIRTVFQEYCIDKKYIANGKNRKHFIALLRRNGFVLSVIHQLWYDLGGIVVDEEEGNEHQDKEETDLDLDSLGAVIRNMFGLN